MFFLCFHTGLVNLKQTTNNATDNEHAIIFWSRKALMLPFRVFREKMLISCKACYLIPLCIYCVNLRLVLIYLNEILFKLKALMWKIRAPDERVLRMIQR